MSWKSDREETERLEDEALSRAIDRALSGKKRKPEAEVIREQSVKWKSAWMREERS